MGKLSRVFTSRGKKRFVLAGAFALLVSGLFVTAGQAAPASEQVAAPAAVGFGIASNFNNKCLSIAGNNSGSGALVYLWQCDGVAGQRWTWDGPMLRSVLNPNQCLDVGGANPDNGGSLNTWECYGGAAQQWDWHSGLLSNRIANRCLAIDNANPWNGAVAHLWDCNGPSHQRWHIA